MKRKDIILKINQYMTELEIRKPNQLIIAINGVYFWADRIVYDDEHCWLYKNSILVGFVNLNDIHFIEMY